MVCFIPAVFILLAGSLTDRCGRKLSMMIVLVVYLIYGIIFIVTASNMDWSYEIIHWTKLALEMSGCEPIFNIAVYAYISNITTAKKRTKRFCLLDAVWYLGGPIGTLLGGWLYAEFGYVTVFAISTLLWLISFLYVWFYVQENRCGSSYGSGCSLMKPIRHTIHVFRTALRKRHANGRVHLLSVIAIKLAMFFVGAHEVYLWSRKMLEWNATQYSNWSGVDEGLRQVGGVLWIFVATKKGLHDTTVAMVGLASALSWSISLACINKDESWWLVDIASFFGILQESVKPALMALLLSLANKNEIGHLLTLLELLESIWATVDTSLHTYLYNTYSGIFPQVIVYNNERFPSRA